MALEKSKELSSGSSGSYWKIAKVEVDGSYARVLVSLYKDADARTASKSPMTQQEYFFIGEANPCTIALMDVVSSNPVKLCYAKLKTLEEFSGAQDV